jgi:cytochrome b561
MVLMVLKKSLHLTIITVCVCVIIVSGLLAYYSRKTAFEILGLTATYAAVLVVFVGASS